MRIQKIIAARGLMSRRAAEEYIRDGRVTVNERPVCLGDGAAEDDIIAIDGIPLGIEPKKIYIMLNKPRGIVCTMDDERGRRTVTELVSDINTRVLPVGRLDMDSEGLLLMTNDNGIINILTHPSYEIDKEYHVYVRVPDSTRLDDAVHTLRQPMDIEGYTTKPAIARILKHSGKNALLSIVIHEGRKRQVRHMCKNASLSVDRLIRVRIGSLELGDLESGKWKHCDFADI
jgi:23S rRNA pseudouridine2605 synthase